MTADAPTAGAGRRCSARCSSAPPTRSSGSASSASCARPATAGGRSGCAARSTRDRHGDRRGADVFSTAARARRDAAEVLRQPPRGGLPVVRARSTAATRSSSSPPACAAARASRSRSSSIRCVFVTLTAPSFGPVHSRRAERDGKARRCRPRRDGAGLPARRAALVRRGPRRRMIRGSASRCARTASTTSRRCCGTRWRRSCGAARRSRSRASSRAWSGVTQRRLRERVRVSYVKVAEYQRRGALHFHVVVRLDARAAEGPRPSWSSRRRREFTARAARPTRSAPRSSTHGAPPPRRERRRRGATAAREVRWGAQVDACASSTCGRARRGGACAGYIAKYATKSTEVVGGLMHRLDGARPRAAAGAAARAAAGASARGARRRAASRAAAAAAVGARARVPRALLHQEPPLLDDVHARCAGRATSTSCAGSTAASRATRGAGR